MRAGSQITIDRLAGQWLQNRSFPWFEGEGQRFGLGQLLQVFIGYHADFLVLETFASFPLFSGQLGQVFFLGQGQG